MTRTAISPRFAIRIFWSTADNVGVVTAGEGIWDDVWDAHLWPAGWRVHHVAETTSTNTVLAEALEAGVVGDRTVLVADHQTAGRGRLDRRWEAPPGANLLVSFGFTDVPPSPSELTRRLGLAIVRAARPRRPDVEIGLKWPNDILLAGRKLAGVLAQRSVATGFVVVGAGVNLAWSPWDAAQLDDESRGVACSPADLLVDVLRELDALGASIDDEYRAALETLGQEVRVELPDDSTLQGVAVDVDADGRLVVDAHDGTQRVLDVGDVVHVRPVRGQLARDP